MLKSRTTSLSLFFYSSMDLNIEKVEIRISYVCVEFPIS